MNSIRREDRKGKGRQKIWEPPTRRTIRKDVIAEDRRRHSNRIHDTFDSLIIAVERSPS